MTNRIGSLILKDAELFTICDCMLTMKDLMEKDPKKYTVTDDDAFKNILMAIDTQLKENK